MTTHRFSRSTGALTIQVEGRSPCAGFAPLTLTVVQDNDHHCVSTLCGTVADQAALQGMLRALYSLGLPLLLVRCERCREDASDNPSHC
jgi:hypothetical protein